MENLNKRPSKGILKNSSSIERQDSKLIRQNSHDKDIKWDEMNILQTLHPPDKDYGHMKIEEPKTPFSYYVADDDGGMQSDNEDNTSKEIDPDNLAELINQKAKSAFSFDEPEPEPEPEPEEDMDFSDLTEEEKERRKKFEVHRKIHYNEYQMVKLARKLMKEELEEDDDEDVNNSVANEGELTPSTSQSASNTNKPDDWEDISQA